MKVAACFHCEDHLMDDFGGKKLINSFKYFHPEIPIMHFGNREQEIIKEKYPGFGLYSFNPAIMLETKREYDADLVVFIDCDSIVLDRLDDILYTDYDVASCKNDPDCHTQNEEHNRPIKGIPNQEWVNAGLVACRNEEFLKDWIKINADAIYTKGGINYYKGVEQDTFNMVFHSGRYKTRILDDNEYECFYGPSSQYITEGRVPPESIKPYGNYFCESWLDIKLINNAPYLHGKRIPLIHHCHGGKLKLQYDIFSDDFREYIKQVTGLDK